MEIALLSIEENVEAFLSEIPKEGIKSMLLDSKDFPSEMANGYKFYNDLKNDNIYRKSIKVISTWENSMKIFDRKQFFAGKISEDGRFIDDKLNKAGGPWGLSTSRKALNTLAACKLLNNRIKASDILKPENKGIREEIGGEIYNKFTAKALHTEDKDNVKKYMDALKTDVADTLANALKTLIEQTNEDIAKLDNITAEEIFKPENAHIISNMALLQDIAQELGRNEIHPEAKKCMPEIQNYIDMQRTGCIVLNNIVSGYLTKAGFTAEDKKYIFGDENASLEKDAVATNLTKSLPQIMVQSITENIVNQNRKKDEPFFKTFGGDNDIVQKIAIQSGKMLKSGLCDKLADYVVGDSNHPNIMENCKNLGKRMIEGKLLGENDIEMEDDGPKYKKIVFDKIDNINARVKNNDFVKENNFVKQ